MRIGVAYSFTGTLPSFVGQENIILYANSNRRKHSIFCVPMSNCG